MFIPKALVNSFLHLQLTYLLYTLILDAKQFELSIQMTVFNDSN